jgi:hypothetical protein
MRYDLHICCPFLRGALIYSEDTNFGLTGFVPRSWHGTWLCSVEIQDILGGFSVRFLASVSRAQCQYVTFKRTIIVANLMISVYRWYLTSSHSSVYLSSVSDIRKVSPSLNTVYSVSASKIQHVCDLGDSWVQQIFVQRGGYVPRKQHFWLIRVGRT